MIRVRDRLERLAKCSKQFVSSHREVRKLLSIYNDPLSIKIVQFGSVKPRVWAHYDMWLRALPQIANSQGHLTATIQYLETVPTSDVVSSLGVLPRSLESEDQWE